jgi:epoxide hydrolase-like predicted phosphatase
VIFDFGGVISSVGRPSEMISRFEGADRDTVMRIFTGEPGTDTDHPFHRLERGEITFGEFGDYLKSAIADAGLVPLERTSPPREGGIAIEFSPNEPVIELVDDLRSAGFRLGVLTNNIRELRDSWRKLMDFDSVFHDVVDSSEVGLRKPDPRVYHLAAQRLGTTPERTAFLDDLQHNVDGAAAVGMLAFRVDIDPRPAVAAVRKLCGLVR